VKSPLEASYCPIKTCIPLRNPLVAFGTTTLFFIESLNWWEWSGLGIKTRKICKIAKEKKGRPHHEDLPTIPIS
jgi:hypothetical protein